MNAFAACARIAPAAVLLLALAAGCARGPANKPKTASPGATPTAPHGDSSYYEYKAEQDGFSVTLPATHRGVQRETAPMDTPLGPKTRVTHSVEAGDLLFMVNLVPLPELNIMQERQRDESVEDLARGLAKHGNLLSLEPARASGGRAWRVRYTATIQGHTLHFAALVLYRNAHLHQFQAGALDPSLLDSPAVSRFLESPELFN
jgi:hypothetical protein